MDMAAAISGSSQPTETSLSEPVWNLLQKVSATDPRQEALMQALRPYLKPNRQNKLERALQIAQLSRFAKVAMQNASLPTEQEAEHV